jgi:hypothetical protein
VHLQGLDTAFSNETDKLEPQQANRGFGVGRTSGNVLCYGEPVILQSASRVGSSVSLSAFAAGFQVQAQYMAHALRSGRLRRSQRRMARRTIGASRSANTRAIDLTTGQHRSGQ